MSLQKVSREVKVGLAQGLHLVPCSRIAAAANRFDGPVEIQKGTMKVNAKTILDLMTLGAEQGTVLVLEAHGERAEDVINELVLLFETDFVVGEETESQA